MRVGGGGVNGISAGVERIGWLIYGWLTSWGVSLLIDDVRIVGVLILIGEKDEA